MHVQNECNFGVSLQVHTDYQNFCMTYMTVFSLYLPRHAFVSSDDSDIVVNYKAKRSYNRKAIEVTRKFILPH